MKQHVYAVAEMAKAAEKTAMRSEKETEKSGSPEYVRLYQKGRADGARVVGAHLAVLVEKGDALDEDAVKKLVSQWRMAALQMLQEAFKAEEKVGRYQSRHALGMQNSYALAAIELERLLKGGVPQVAVAPAVDVPPTKQLAS